MAGSPQQERREEVATGTTEETLVVPDNVEAPRLARLWLADRVADLPSEVVHDAVL